MNEKPHILVSPHLGCPINVLIYKEKGDEKKPDKKPIGYFMFVIEHGESMVIYYMYIQPEYRGKGYGKMAVDIAKKDAQEVRTQLAPSSEESISFLKSQGFVEENGWLVWHKKT